MGTFDSVYLNKIRHLEEENQQLKNILNEYIVDSPALKAKRERQHKSGIDNYLRDLPQLGDAGPQLTPEGKQRLFDSMKKLVKRIGDDGPPRTEEQKQKTRESQMSMYREMKKRGDLVYEPRQPILDRKPAPNPSGLRDKSEPAPYASDDMESRRAEEAERVRVQRQRDELRGGPNRPPLRPLRPW